jgi:uncharacterized protein YeaO (DUF488 family)
MSLGIYRYGERTGLRGLCIGVTRYPPRGVSPGSQAAIGCYDVWLPLLAPSRELISAFKSGGMPFARFAARYRREMQHSDPRHVITTLAAVAQHQAVHLGCYCADETRCHRSLLLALLLSAQDTLPPPLNRSRARPSFASPACSMPEIED